MSIHVHDFEKSLFEISLPLKGPAVERWDWSLLAR